MTKKPAVFNQPDMPDIDRTWLRGRNRTSRTPPYKAVRVCLLVGQILEGGTMGSGLVDPRRPSIALAKSLSAPTARVGATWLAGWALPSC